MTPVTQTTAKHASTIVIARNFGLGTRSGVRTAGIQRQMGLVRKCTLLKLYQMELSWV